MTTQELRFHPVSKEGCRTPSPGEPMSPATAPLSSSSCGTSPGHGGHGVVPNPFGSRAPAPGVAPVAPSHQWISNTRTSSFESNNVSRNSTIPSNSSIPTVVSATSGDTWSYANSANAESCPNFSVGVAAPGSSPRPGKPTASGAGRRRYGKTGENAATDSVTARRQKRLERNRESARLSRRRRKQYLEVLEERVSQLSMEMDIGRREHVAKAVETIQSKRRDALDAADKPEEQRVILLDTGLSRTNTEMMLATTFKHQQLKSFSLPPHSKFYLWLTLQSDSYFRGGRAASERLSAARIGERMLSSGNDRVTPAQSMWPLFCNEVGLSYDQEERVRTLQRNLLQAHESWLERHTARASDLVMASSHDSTQALTARLRQRERSMLSVLTNSQRLKFLSWAERNRDRIARLMKDKGSQANMRKEERDFKVCKSQHTAANLYIINCRLQRVLDVIPRARPLVSAAELKKLSRRPSFESLGRAGDKQLKEDGLSYDSSFASSGSLKRSASSLSMDDQDKPQVQQISPEEAEATAAPTVEKTLGFVKRLIPPPPVTEYVINGASAVQLRIPSPTQVTSTPTPMTNHVVHSYTYAPPPAPPLLSPVPSAPLAPHATHAPLARHVETYNHAAQAQYSQSAASAPIAPSAPPPTPQPTMYVAPPPAVYAPPPPPPPPPLLPPPPPPPPPPAPSTVPSAPAPPGPVPAPPAIAVPPAMSAPPAPASAPPAPVSAPPALLVSSAQHNGAAYEAEGNYSAAQHARHVRASSFLPPHLNVVPEEMFPADASDDFLMNLMADDWAIGEGVDMDTTR